MINDQGQNVRNVSESMSIGQTAIRRWLQQYSAEQSGHLVAQGTQVICGDFVELPALEDRQDVSIDDALTHGRWSAFRDGH
jgi:transposase-like protein